ncbi:MAG: hypothetical protein M0P01_06245 [Treponema sp.]|nr:hypothetical protein [Treponema sp.]
MKCTTFYFLFLGAGVLTLTLLRHQSDIISNEVEERITYNIFYTAITRAKKELKNYWSPEVEKNVLNNFKLKQNDKDVSLLKSLFKP